MRDPIAPQKKLGAKDIEKVKIDLRSRDEIPKILLGLQHIYCTPELREKVFAILKEMVPGGVDATNGRKGMDLWNILVLGCVRLNCNWDYDKLQDIANNHRTIREMLGHGMLDSDYQYALQTLKDNVSLFTPELLERISQVVVEAGHQLIYGGKKNEKIELKGKCDSFVVESNVHFPTDINLLLDGITKAIRLVSKLCSLLGINGWRQSNHNLKTVKKHYRKVQKLKRSTSKDEAKKEKRDAEILDAYLNYVNVVESFLERVSCSIKEVRSKNFEDEKIESLLSEIETFSGYARHQISLIEKRKVDGEIIPHEEKLFSLFEPYTEWISKGKAGVPQELGLRVCVLQDQHGFFLHHRVMEKETDEKVTVKMVVAAKEKHPDLNSCSYDKGFYSKGNLAKLKELLDFVVLPKKGKLSEEDKELEHSEEFVRTRNKHSAVESCINALENHGLDRCPDRGIDGFKRYVGLAVLGRNLQVLGDHIQQKELKKLKRRERLKSSGGEPGLPKAA